MACTPVGMRPRPHSFFMSVFHRVCPLIMRENIISYGTYATALTPTAMQVTLESGVLALSLWEGFNTHHTINVTVIPGSSDGLEYVENVGIGESVWVLHPFPGQHCDELSPSWAL